MVKSGKKQSVFTDLEEVRRAIDAVDNEILDKFGERLALVNAVQGLKSENYQENGVIRPGRETQLLRRLVRRGGGRVPAEFIIAVWREIVGWATQAQARVGVHFSSGHDDAAFWRLIRDHFGAFAEIACHQTQEGALEAVVGEPADVAVLPAIPADDNPWLSAMLKRTQHNIRVVGAIPQAGGGPEAFLAARAPVETTGDDCTVACIETDKDFSDRRVTAALEGGGFKVLRVARQAKPSESDAALWLIECVATGTAGDEGLRRELEATGLGSVTVLGGYPTQLSLDDVP